VVSIRPTERRLAPTTPSAAIRGQRLSWKYVSTATARARMPAAMK
jgi:hypothetical protein